MCIAQAGRFVQSFLNFYHNLLRTYGPWSQLIETIIKIFHPVWAAVAGAMGTKIFSTNVFLLDMCDKLNVYHRYNFRKIIFKR